MNIQEVNLYEVVITTGTSFYDKNKWNETYDVAAKDSHTAKNIAVAQAVNDMVVRDDKSNILRTAVWLKKETIYSL